MLFTQLYFWLRVLFLKMLRRLLTRRIFLWLFLQLCLELFPLGRRNSMDLQLEKGCKRPRKSFKLLMKKVRLILLNHNQMISSLQTLKHSKEKFNSSMSGSDTQLEDFGFLKELISKSKDLKQLVLSVKAALEKAQ